MRRLFTAIVGSCLLSGCGFPLLTCQSSATLESLVTCVRDQMPQSGSNGYVVPTPGQREDWRTVVRQMLKGSCDFALPSSLDEVVQVRTFTDSGNSRNYCLLMEVGDRNRNNVVDNGFGTFIVFNGAVRELSHQAVHPIADSTTEIQAVTVFKNTDSRSYLMAGAHRDANAARSTCRTSFPESDASHNINTMVQVTAEELLAHYGDAPWFAIQWHGMAASTCPKTDVYPSHGRNAAPAPTDKNAVLRDNLLALHSTWHVDLPGSGSCDLNATENAQGLLLNGVGAEGLCGPSAPSYTQKFLHIEQDPNFRNPDDWIPAIVKTFP